MKSRKEIVVADICAAGEEVFPAGYERIVNLRGPLHHHDLLEVGKVVTLGIHLFPLAFVLEKHDGGLRVMNDVLHLLCGAGGVDARRGCANCHSREIHDDPLGAVEAQDAGRLPRLQPSLHKGLADFLDLIGVLGPTRGDPDTVIAYMICRLVAPLLNLLKETSGDRIGAERSAGIGVR